MVSLVCPVYKPELHHFRAAVESVFAQTYPNWELILVDDSSRSPAVSAQITAFAARDSRIRALRMPHRGGISAASNQALGAAKGEWIGFFDHDDLLVDVALAVMLDHAAASGASLLYSDEDKIEPNGRLTEPHFKPDWNYRLLLGNNYVCHFLMVRRATLGEVGPLRSTYDGAQDHDLLLRLAEYLPASAIHHVPEVLYHWRRTGGSTAATPAAKPYTARAGVAAIEAHLKRRRLPGRADAHPQTTLYRVTWLFSSKPSVAIIIPFRDAVAMTRRCVESLLQLTAYAKFEILLVDNWSTEPDVLAVLDALRTEPRVRVLRVEEEFNFSRLNNRAAASTDADFLVLHNNDVLHNDPEWLTSLVSEALADPAVAVVGAKLLYPFRAIQHAGVLLGMWGVAGHMHGGLPADAPGYAGRALLTQEVSAVTAACMLVRHSVYDGLGGLDEQALPVTFNDVDFCLRARAAGHKVIQANDCVAEHHESFSRGADDEPAKEARFRAECRIMKERWGEILRRDPFYNPHFDLEGEAFRDLLPP